MKTLYRVSVIERNARKHLKDANTRKAIEEALFETDGECPTKLADFATEEQATAFARAIDTKPFTQYDPTCICWKNVIIDSIFVDEDGDEEYGDESYTLGETVESLMAFASTLDEEAE